MRDEYLGPLWIFKYYVEYRYMKWSTYVSVGVGHLLCEIQYSIRALMKIKVGV